MLSEGRRHTASFFLWLGTEPNQPGGPSDGNQLLRMKEQQEEEEPRGRGAAAPAGTSELHLDVRERRSVFLKLVLF